MNLKLSIVPLILFLSGCAETRQSDKGCPETSVQQDAEMTAETHYRIFAQCIRAKNEARAISHFALAGTGTWYDSLVNPGEESARRHSDLLKKQLAGLNEREREQSWETINRTLNDPVRHKALCEYIAQTGKSRATHPRFNLEEWYAAREGYLHCVITQSYEG